MWVWAKTDLLNGRASSRSVIAKARGCVWVSLCGSGVHRAGWDRIPAAWHGKVATDGGDYTGIEGGFVGVLCGIGEDYGRV
jgi:hypothetical protein